MMPRSDEELDALIEQSLRNEPIRQEPPSFGLRFRRRFEYAVRLTSEQRRLRRAAGAGLGAAAGLTAFAGALAWKTGAASWLSRSLPGEDGVRDSLRATLLSLPPSTEAAALPMAIAAAALALAALWPFGR
jgi:hypothetical protein